MGLPPECRGILSCEDCMVSLASLHLSHVSRFFMEELLIEEVVDRGAVD